MYLPENIQTLIETRPNVRRVLLMLLEGVPSQAVAGMVPFPRDLEDDLDAMEEAGLIEGYNVFIRPPPPIVPEGTATFFSHSRQRGLFFSLSIIYPHRAY